MSFIKVLAIAWLLHSVVSAKERKTPLVGTWSGTIGKAKINICFQGSSGGYSNGSYYYLRYRQPIRLEPIDDRVWMEPGSEKLVFDAVTERVATGKWVGHGKADTLPIRLKFLGACNEASDYTDSPCECDLFNRPIEILPKPRIESVRKPGGRCHRTFSLSSDNINMAWFELCGKDSISESINLEIVGGRFPSLDSPDAAAVFYSCRRSTLAAFGHADCEQSLTTTPHLWKGDLLVVADEESGYCGGAHDFSSTKYRAFDLSTGESIATESWLENGISEELNHLILSKNTRDPSSPDEQECLEMLKGNDIYSIGIDSVGLSFSTEFGHCCKVCNENVHLTFEELTPFLSEVAKHHLKLK